MAAEVPVCDVLSEAMDYLAKLGSNLRTRSENLKEKRIRKEKLNNSQAVHKAAEKVLLICELSKKSLENVESGMRKVLQLVRSTTENTASTISRNRRSDTVPEERKRHFHYFDHEAQRLKITKKICLKHFMSVKVLAKSMPISMQDKYPVYYDCKLYRKRRKLQKFKTLETDNTVVDDVSSTKETEIESEVQNSNFVNVLRSEKHENQLRKSEDLELNSSKRNERVKSNDKSKKISRNIRVIDSSSDSETTEVVNLIDKKENLRDQNKVIKCEKLTKNLEEEQKSIEQLEKQENQLRKSEDLELSSSKKKERVKSDDKRKKISRNIRIDSSSDSETTEVVKLTDKNDNSNDQNEILNCETLTTKLEEEQKSIEHLLKTMSCSDNSEKKDNIEDSNRKTQLENTFQGKRSPENFIQEESSLQSNEDSNVSMKPLIKCVSINKLLKPEKLPKDGLDNNVNNKGLKSKPTKRLNNPDTDKQLESNSCEDQYWKDKRKEVKKFKPKNFHIKIVRLPKLSVDFLNFHNLKMITKSGTVVCEIPMDVSLCKNKDKQLNIDSVKDKSTKKNEDALSVIASKVKNALLDESESDQELQVESNRESIKNNLLKDCHSPETTINDKDCVEKQQRPVISTIDNQIEGHASINTDPGNHIDNVKNALLNETDSNDDRSTEKTKENKDSEKSVELIEQQAHKSPDKIKSALLNDSSDDSPMTPLSKIKSKRKHMRESMHAKKMLLTYSSSSDTDDEQLQNALKEIKGELLKEVSDDEKITKKRKRRHTESNCSDSPFEGFEQDNKKSKTSESYKLTNVHQEKENVNKPDSTSDEDDSNSSSGQMVRSKPKPSSSSQSLDSQDTDKDIDGLTNLNTLVSKTRRRRGSTSTDRTERSSGTLKLRLPKVPKIVTEEILKADDSSDAQSEEENENEESEDLAPVTMPGLNGDGISDYGKDDLLGESDSSVSHKDKSSDSIQKDDESEDENVKLKRRKALAISSDSEAGSSRKKDKDVKISDFEDSEDESSECTKKSKRKKKGSDSDGSVGSNSDGKKKRRRIKSLDSEGSGSDSENEGRNKHGRKNIRKVMGKNQLEEATKKAAREERERMVRIAERQKMYNNMQFDESGKPDEVVLEKVVLDFDPETKEPLIEVDRGLVKKLKPHQANGIKFMWDACFESVKRIKKDRGSGCILAHCMGLGKTLQVVSLTHTLLTYNSLTNVNRVLVVCPLSTVLNWVNEFRIWLKHTDNDFEVDVYELSRFKQNSERAFQLQQWFDNGGVCVLGYEMFRNLSADNSKKFKKKMLKSFQESLVDPGPDLVVCDEGHLLKNEKTSLSQSMNRVKTYRRIVLTGTPLQNNLKEYYCMVTFVKPNLLGKYNEYLNRFVNPITNGQYTDSTEHDIRIMKRRSHVLHKMLDGAVQRRDYGVLAPFLPPKHEYVLFITLTDLQTKLYQYYLDNYSRRPLPGKSSGFLFPDFQSLQRIWTHPLVLKYNSERYEIMQQKKRDREEEEDSEGSLADFIDDDSSPEESSTDESSDDMSDASDDSRKKSKKKKSNKKTKKESKVSTRRGTRANPTELVEDEKDDDVLEVKYENPTEWWIKLVTDAELDDLGNSHKLVLLFDILRQCEAIGDKLLVFSQSLYSLDLIEHFLGKVDEATQEGRVDEKLGGHVGSWSPGIDYFRLDGSTSCENRSIWCKNFNREDNPRARLFLISTRAGGLGINLVAANRVVIFDVSWNPSHDVQSIFRVYRFGQKKPCYVYRFLAMGTMEEKIYERQVTKQAISKRVIDEQQIDRHYAENDLAELYKFEPQPPEPRPVPLLPKDRLFAEMLKEHEAQIYKYHEHDSLLENKEEETLSEEERKAAWEDFENEKNKPPPAPFPSAWPMHNGMMPGLLAQQQQQLAYAALAAMLRKDMPNINDNQIRDMLPLIYNSNPALMQKMGEIYKYAQPGMMNPGMMNPMMNAASGGMGGTSGLQYEPPWQRQQQQQQQMRLQQIMQQQNQMGAKFYAGGLGSRDPVAMALQQQRAREIMLSGGGAPGSRPRGRPPLQPRAPSTAPDVVNLDSD